MRKKVRIILILLLLLILVALNLTNINNLNLPVLSYGFIHTPNIDTIIEYGEHSVIAAHYPVFGLGNIDRIIKNLVFEYINSFKDSFKDLSVLDTNYKSELHIDYEVYSAPKNIVSVKIIILENMYYYSFPETTIETLIFDLSNDKQILLMNRFEDIFYEIVNSYRSNTLTTFSPLEVTDKANMENQPNIITDTNVSRMIDINKPMVALTFDDGPYNRATIPILNTLKKYNSVATFFVLGNRVQNNKSIIKRINEEGSEIGNHSYNHKQLTTLPSSELKEQISKTQKLVFNIAGVEPKIMRPTYGSYDNKLRTKISMPMILWSIDPMDWKVQDAKKINDHILNRVKDGDIILMHDIFVSTAEAVELLVPQLIDRGFQLVTISELYEAKGKALEVGKIYRHLKQN